MGTRTKKRGKRVLLRMTWFGFLKYKLVRAVTWAVLVLALIFAIIGGIAFNHFNAKYSKIVNLRLDTGAFDLTARFLAVPRTLHIGDIATTSQLANNLRAAGYTQEEQDNPVGWYRILDETIEIFPGPQSHFAPEAAMIVCLDGVISRIIGLDEKVALRAYQLEPELITNLSDAERSKRRLFKFDEYPEHLVQAVIAIEDHRFYSHNGIDFIRTSKAAFDGITQWKIPRGTSTLTQQLARNFFLTREVTYSRKLAEAMIALQLEQRLSKEKIFEYYSNQISMGRLESFNVHGLGEAARGFFDKDVRDITLAEAALLAGLPQGPSYLNPYRHPDRARNRRNQVLAAMLRHNFISEESYQKATQEEIVLSRGHMESRDAPYYIDLVKNSLKEHFKVEDLITQNYWVFTTMDKQLQDIAVQAVRDGMKLVDEQVAEQARFKDKKPPLAQAALVAMDPRTGQIKAIVGGRDYGDSQLNRALAKRQPGSIFKPFVYAAAIDSALDSERAMVIEQGYGDSLPEYARKVYDPPQVLLTPGTLVEDTPVTYNYDKNTRLWVREQPLVEPENGLELSAFSELEGLPPLIEEEDEDEDTADDPLGPYTPSNHKEKYFGLVSMRYALIHSLNVATLKVGEMAGFQRIADLAERAGMGENLLAVPSLTLGSFEVTPLQVAGAYSAFVNNGVHVAPEFIKYVRDDQGQVLYKPEGEKRELFDRRVAYMVTHMMQDVVNNGTGVRARFTYQLTEPAAGKTGTDDDGWFAGFTNSLLCVVWVGFDDNTDLSIEGSHSALPIWAQFMKQAHQLAEYRDPESFEVPDGVVRMPVDPVQNMFAENYCTGCSEEVYLSGTQPMHSSLTEYLEYDASGTSSKKDGSWRARPKKNVFGRIIGLFQNETKAVAPSPEP